MGWLATAPALAEDLPRKKFTRSEVRQLVESGVLAGQRFELIDGDLINKMGQNPPHANGILTMSDALANVYGLKRLRIQLPMEVAKSDRQFNDPEPDLVVLASSPEKKFLDRHPRADECALVIEVADSTVIHDCNKKRDMYARAGAPEYWVVDVNERRIIVHRKLSNDGYTETTILTGGEIALPQCPGSLLHITDLFPVS